MKALCWHGKNDIRCDTVPDPKIEDPRDVIIKVTSCAICGSDLHLMDGLMPTMKSGDVLGHEFMGEVVETGRGLLAARVLRQLVGDGGAAGQIGVGADQRQLPLLVGPRDGAAERRHQLERIGERWALTPEHAPAYAGPTVVVAGRLDSTVGYAAATELLEHYPHASLAVVDDAGHALPHEQPDLLRALLAEWLARVERSS